MDYLMIFLAVILLIFMGVAYYIILQKNKKLKELELAGKYLNCFIEKTIHSVITINEKGLIQSFNPGAEEIFGYKADEVIGENVKILMPGQYSQHHDGYIKHYIDTGERKVIDKLRQVEARHKNGSLFPIELTMSQIKSDDGYLFTSIIRDISIQRKYETELQNAYKKLEEFANITAHDLREPLRGIKMSYCQILCMAEN